MIEDFNKTLDIQNREIILSNHIILFKLCPKDAGYYFNKGKKDIK